MVSIEAIRTRPGRFPWNPMSSVRLPLTGGPIWLLNALILAYFGVRWWQN